MKIDPNGNSWIFISEFHQQSYCEVQLKFIWQGIIRKTEKMIEGSLIHEEKFEKFVEETKEAEEVGIKEAIKRAVENNEKFSGREVRIISPTFRLIGIIDSIEIGPDGILIIDDKPSKYVHLSDKSQVSAYAIAFKDLYRPPLDIFMIIRSRDKGHIIWKDVLTEEQIILMLDKINRMHELAIGKREFEPTKNPKKCSACCYRDLCESKLI